MNTIITPSDADNKALTISFDNTDVASATTTSNLTDGSFNVKLNAIGATVAHIKSANGVTVDVTITVNKA